MSPDIHPWIYLNGHPGIGKLTIARELAKLIPGSKVIDNHLVIDLCRSVFEMASDEYESLRQEIRQQLLTAISSSEVGRRTTYIFTGSHMKDNLIGHLVARDYENQAKAGNTPFVSIILTCDEEEHLRRATSPSRLGKHGAPGKLTNLDTLKAIRAMEVFRFHCEHEWVGLDVTKLTAPEAAKKVKEFLDSITNSF